MTRARSGEPPAVRIEAANEWAWCGDRRLELTPKAFAVLRHFVEHARRLVTKDELLGAVWSDTVVSEAALTSCIRDLRRALDDSSRTPRYIETVHRRGFRFIGPTTAPAPPASRRAQPTEGGRAPTLVGRDADLARLEALFETALGARRQLVFVTGEAGIGKTTLVEAFLSRLDAHDGLRIGRGQCVEQYGAGEAYLPILEALGRMGRGARGDALIRTLKQYAPTWLAQLPALLTDEDFAGVQRRAQGTTRERMLRELVEAFDVLGADAPVVLVLEDLHWSDSSTIDLLAMLARRTDPARLLVLATYRPADVAVSDHPVRPLKHELQAHGQCAEVALDFLDETALGDYLAGRFPGTSFPSRFVRILHRNTSGNPLFLVNVIDHLVGRGHLREVDGRWALAAPLEEVAAAVPQTLWQIVEKQIERLTPLEQEILAVASVAGAEFSAAVATADGIDAHEAERACAALARRGQLLRAIGSAEWPDGTVAERYGFIHALYQNVLYARVPIGRRVGLHLRIGSRVEHAHGPRAAEVAGELAMHFEHGRDFARTVHYRRQAAEAALRQHAYREAADHARRALRLLATLPDSPERDQQELALQTILGATLIAKSWTAPEVGETFARARALCTRMGATPQLLPVLGGLFGFYVTRAELGVARDLAEQLLTLAAATDDPAVRVGAHNAAGMTSFYAGEFAVALEHLERGLALYHPEQHRPDRSPAFWGGHDVGVSCTVHAAWAAWALGYPERAAARMREAIARAPSLAHPFTSAFTYHFAASFQECRGDVGAVRELTGPAIEHATENDFELFSSLGAVHRGWLLCHAGRGEEGVAQMRSGLTAYRATGAGFGLPAFFAFLAEACVQLGRRDDGLSAVAEARAIAEQSGSHFWDAELHRLEGELILQSTTAPASRAAEAHLRDAMEVAKRQQAKAFELRAALSLARLWRSEGRIDEARRLVSGVHDGFTEGFETPEMLEARALLGIDASTSRA